MKWPVYCVAAQAVGKSATAMPLRYGRAPDDNWYIGDNRPLAEAPCYFKHWPIFAARSSKAAGQNTDPDRYPDPRPVVSRPKPGNALDVDVKLIDLPGLDARATENEQHLVEQLAPSLCKPWQTWCCWSPRPAAWASCVRKTCRIRGAGPLGKPGRCAFEWS